MEDAKYLESMVKEKYGVKIYIELMGRYQTNERLKELVLNFYENGAERIGMWDSCGRVPRTAMWNMGSKCGHKEELAAMDPKESYRVYWIRRLAGNDVSRYDPFWGG